MNPKFARITVLCGLCCCLCLWFILSNIFSIVISTALCLVTVVFLFIVSLRTLGGSSAVFLLVCTFMCCASGIATSQLTENKAYEFIKHGHKHKDNQYTAEIVEVNTYSSYSDALAKIVLVNGKELNQEFRCKLGFYTGEIIVPGNTVTFTGVPYSPSNSQQDIFDNVSYQRSRKVFISFPNIEILSVSADGKDSLTSKIRRYIERVIYKYVPVNLNLDTADISYAMILGDKSFISDELKNTFTRSGIIHLLCVSGLHISIIMGSLYSFLRTINIRKGIKFTIIVSFGIFYLALIGFPVSAVRACLICIIGYCASLIGKSTDGFSSLFTSLILICAASPYSILDISAQLSFFATLGIITLCDCFCNNVKHNSVSRAKKLLFTLKSMLIANIGAVIFSCLISAKSFGGFSTVSIISTLLTSFSCEILLNFLLLLILLSPLTFISPVLRTIGSICNILAGFIVKVANFLADIKYSYTETENVSIPLAIFLILTVLLCLFIFFDFKAGRLCVVFCVMILCIFTSFTSLISNIYKDSFYSISYFRQNENDRQMSIKLGHEGYLIINSDSVLCKNQKKAVFDTHNGLNYLLIIPDDLINPAVLSKEIEHFNKMYGIKKVFLPDTDRGKELYLLLANEGCTTYFVDESLDFGTMKLDFDFSEHSLYFTANDGKTKTSVLFSDSYSADCFDKDCNIAAYFTRKTKNQFNIKSDILPPCDIFVTRLKEGESHNKIYNTNGMKNFYIKE